MVDKLVPVLSQVNPTVLMVLAVIAVILFIVSLIKRAVKVGIYMLILALLLGGGIPTVNKIKESYDIKYDKVSTVLTIKIAGKENTLPMKEILADKNYDISMEKTAKSTKLSVTYKQKDGTVVSIGRNNDAIAIPNFMAEAVKKFFDNNKVKYSYRENTDPLGAGTFVPQQ